MNLPSLACISVPSDFAQRRPGLVIVTGEPGSGKSSLGLHLARSLRLPYLSRDDVRWGLHATAGIWTNQLGQASDRNVARETFIEIVEEVARRGVSGVLEFIPFRDRPHELRRLRALAECLVVLTICTDASRRAEDRERSDALLNRPPVLAALGMPPSTTTSSMEPSSVGLCGKRC